MIQHLKVQLLQLPLINLHSLRLPRSYAEPLWKGCRDDRLFFSWFTASSQYLACRFLCRYHHRRVSISPMNTTASVNICKQCCFPVLPYPCHFHRVCVPPVGHWLSQYRPGSSSDGIQHEVTHLLGFWRAFRWNRYCQSVLGGEEILG